MSKDCKDKESATRRFLYLKKKKRERFIYFFFFRFLQYVSIHAAYLYDSVKLYARALDQLLRDQPEHSLQDIVNNGTQIIETIIKNHTYQSKYV